MKKLLYLILVLSLMTSCAEMPEVGSPDGRLLLTFRLTETGSPEYAVAVNGKQVICWSALGLTTEQMTLYDNFELKKQELIILPKR